MNNKFNKNILFSGGMILEVVLMISIVMMLYPVINQQTIKRKTKLRDVLIVKEISTIKQVFERFLLKYVESFPKNATCNINLSDLKSECQGGKVITPPEGFNNNREFLNKIYSMGLPVGLGKGTNMLGQKYSVRVRRKSIKKSNVDVVEAIVIASGNEEVEDVTIRSIVRELGFSGGYIEGNAIIGMNWLDESSWKYSKEEEKDKFSDGTLINKLTPVRADKSLLVKYKTTSILDNTMQTNILINNKDIKRVNGIDTKSGQYVNLKADNINIEVGNDVDFQIDDKIKVNDGITYDNVDFDLGFNASRGYVKLTGNNDSLKFGRDLVVDSLSVKSIPTGSFSPVKSTELKAAQIDSDGKDLDVQVNGLLNVSKINATNTGGGNDNEGKLKINSLYASTISTINGGKDSTVKYGEVFARFREKDKNSGPGISPVTNPCKDCVLYLAEYGASGGNLSKFNDLVVSELNRKLDGVKLGKFKSDNKKFDGVIVRYDTTLGEILTNLELEQKMVQKAIEKYFNPDWEGF